MCSGRNKSHCTNSVTSQMCGHIVYIDTLQIINLKEPLVICVRTNSILSVVLTCIVWHMARSLQRFAKMTRGAIVAVTEC